MAAEDVVAHPPMAAAPVTLGGALGHQPEAPADRVESPRTRVWPVIAAMLMIVGCGFAAYSDSLNGGFVFDDLSDIVNRPSIHHVWPVWRATMTFDEHGWRVHPRPVVMYSYALNYAWAGLAPRGYHAVNLTIHLLAGLALFGLARRTMLFPSMRRYAGSATGLALAIALLWTLHPLNTQAVSYIVQRYESLMGLFYLLTMYCAARAMSALRPLPWAAASVEFAVLALGSKEVAVSLPVMVLLYDRAFVSGSFREAWRRRMGYYFTLFGLLLFFIPFYAKYSGGEWAGHGILVSWDQYAVSEPGVILHYLRLAIWPSGQCLDYAWPVAQTALSIAPPMLAVGGMLAATLWGTIYRPKLGFLGAWFFLILAPTSSVMPIIDLAFEHRMYLSLAAVVAAAVFAVHALVERLAPATSGGRARIAVAGGLLFATSLALGIATYQRNQVWRNELAIWTDNVEKRPNNSRAHSNRGYALLNAQQIPEAKEEFKRAIELAPESNIDARANLGTALMQERDLAGARKTLEEAVEMDPKSAAAQRALALVLLYLGETASAEEHFRAALALAPTDSKLRFNYAGLQIKLGRTQQAVEQMEKALEFNPEYEMAHYALGCVLADQGDLDAAIEHWRAVLRINPSNAGAHAKLAQAYFLQGRRSQARDEVEQCLRFEPKNKLAQQVNQALAGRKHAIGPGR